MISSPSPTQSSPRRRPGRSFVPVALVLGGLAMALSASAGFAAGRGTLWTGALVSLVAAAWVTVVCRRARAKQIEARSQHEELMRGVLSHLQEGVIVANEAGDVLFFNAAAERILGQGAHLANSTGLSSIIGCYLGDTQTPYPQEQLPMARALRGEVVADREVFLRNIGAPDGRWVRVSGTPLRSDDGSTQGAMMVLRDVSSHKRSEQSIRRLSRAVKHTADAVYIADATGTLIYVNPAFERMTGYARHVARRGDLFAVGLCHGDSEAHTSLLDAVQQGQRFRGTTVNRRQDGTCYHGEQTLTPMRDGKGHVTHWVGVCRDMTAHLRMEAHRTEMNLASGVQQRLYPIAAPHVPGFEVAGAVFSAEATCGDYFDFIELPDDRIAIAIGDVSGHGLGPALVMTQVRAYLRAYLQVGHSLSEAFRHINAAIAKDFDGDFFVTLLVLVLNTRDRSIHFCNAGHIPGLLLDPLGQVKAELGRTGLPLGIFADSTYTVGNGVEMDLGDIALLLTDGVIESRPEGGDCLWEEGAIDVVRENAGQAAGDIVERLYERVQHHAAGRPQDDDVTMVVVKACDAPRTPVPSQPNRRPRGLAATRRGALLCRAR